MEDQREQDRLAARLAEGLLLQARMDPCGTALICWMTEKPARTHREAMKYWVIDQLKTLDLTLGHQLIHPLRRLLSELLTRIQEGDA
jgi:hypothetical protein